MIRLFLKLTDFGLFRRLIWKPIYNRLAKRVAVQDWCFMNYGYYPSIHEPTLILEPSDEINRCGIGLYHYLATKVELRGKDVLEVGSGRGGGSAYLKKYLQPSTVIGVDIAENAVKVAQKHYGSEGIGYIQGSAENLPFGQESFDVVINVESSHTYGSVPRFLSEVKRVLRPGGYLLLTDIRVFSAISDLKAQLKHSGMQLLVEENISVNVYCAIETEDVVKQKRIAENIPAWLQKLFREFAGVVGSKAHKGLHSGDLVYYRFVLQKQMKYVQ
jgi:ubiquinone/menaquinone biosynthesis C-methylase UbiE